EEASQLPPPTRARGGRLRTHRSRKRPPATRAAWRTRDRSSPPRDEIEDSPAAPLHHLVRSEPPAWPGFLCSRRRTLRAFRAAPASARRPAAGSSPNLVCLWAARDARPERRPERL